jgi:predicted transporter
MKTSSIFFGFWTLAFLLFAYWQFNDPDPAIWVSIYAYAALMSALAATRRYPLIPLLTGAMLCLLGGIYFFPASVSDWVMQEWQQQDLSMKTLAMEEARESFGLLIVSGITGIAALLGWQKKRKARRRYRFSA